MVRHLHYQPCDEAHIRRGRFLGYAGISMILTIPCFFLSAAAAHRVFQMHLVQRGLFKLTDSESRSLPAERVPNTIELANPSPIQDVNAKSVARFGHNFVDDMDMDIVVMHGKDMLHVDD